MAVTTDAFDSTELAASIPEVWTGIVMEELFAKTVLANWCRDLSSFAAEEGDIFHVPDVFTNSFSVQTQSTQGAEITTDAPAQVDVTLTVNTHEYVAFLLGDKDMRQLSRRFDFNEVYAKKAASTLKDSLEDSLAALWSGLSTNSIGDTGTVVTDLEIRQAIEALDTANFDLSEVAMFLHPDPYWTQVVAIQKYYDSSQSGAASSLTIDGNFGPMDASRGLRGSIYGIPVFVTSNIVSGLQTYRNLVLHKEALGFAIQTPGASDGRCRVQADYLLQNLGMLSVVDIIYGVAELRDAAAVVLNANTTATTA